MLDIITFGSATQDIFIKLDKKNYKIIKNKKFLSNKGICFNFGDKIEVDDLKIKSGGGGTNTAATFALQGLKVGFCGKIGDDLLGENLLKELKKRNIDNKFLLKDKKHPTAVSVILTTGFARTILTWRGACHYLEKKEIPWNQLKAKWFYIAPLSGKSSLLFEDIVKFAKNKGIKIAANLSKDQINLPKKELFRTLSKIDILNLNQEEASLLTKTKFSNLKKIIRELLKIPVKIFIITRSNKGAIASNRTKIFECKILKVKPKEKTGAGDAFGSGFLSGYIKTKNIKYSLQLASANSASCLTKIGAKEGLLKKESNWKKVKVIEKKI